VVSGDSDAVVHRLLGGAPLTDSARFASRPQASRPRGRRRRDDDPEQDVAEPSPDGRRRGRRRGLPTLVLPVGSMAVGAVRQPCQSPLSCCLTLTAAPHPHPSRLPEPLWAVSLRQCGRHGRSVVAGCITTSRHEILRRPDRCWSRADQGLGGMAVLATDGRAARGHASGNGALPSSDTPSESLPVTLLVTASPRRVGVHGVASWATGRRSAARIRQR
jgi:hypothetical protein